MADEIIKLIEYITTNPFFIGVTVLYALLFMGAAAIIFSMIRAIFQLHKSLRDIRNSSYFH